MIRYFLFTLVLFSVIISEGKAITGYVRGRVNDSSTGESLAGVYIFYGKNLGTTTDLSGNYFIRSDSAKLNLTFRFVGYETVSRTVSLIPNDTVVLNVEMVMKIREIDQIVISADRTEQRIAELTVSMNIIKAGFFSLNHITDAQEIINKTPGIEVMDGQASVRGGSGYSYGAGSRVLALIDGLPVISADAGNIKWQFLPLENISQIEIIKGASSVLYGSSALNGVINFRTADATNIPVTQFFTEGGIFDKPRNRNWVWWDTPRVFSSASFSHLQKSGKTDVGLSSYFMIDEGYRRLNWEKLGRLSLKLKHFNSKIEGLTYGLNLNGGYNVKKDFLIWEDAEAGALKQSESTAAEFRGTFLAIDPFISLKKSNHYKHDFRMRVQASQNILPESDQHNSNSLSVYSEYQLWYRLFDFIDLTSGISENYSRVNSNFFGDHKGLNIAGFAQFDIRPLPLLKFVTGIRIENNSLDGISDKIVPIIRAGLNLQMAEYTFLRASFGQGYRYPSIAEKFASTTLGSIKLIPNPDILSESGWSTELGIKQGVSIGKMTGQADLSIFFMQNSNLIEYMFDGMGFKAINVEQSRVYGSEIEFQLSRSFGELNTTAKGGYTFIYPVEFNASTQKNTDIYLKYRRKHSLLLSLNASRKRFNFGLSSYFKSRILNIDDVFLKTDIIPGFNEYWADHNTGYFLMDVNMGYRISQTLYISFVTKNITNTSYMGRPADIQPQRNFSIRLSGKF